MPPENPKRGPKGAAPEEPPKKRVNYSQLRVIQDVEAEKTERMTAELQELIRQVRREYDFWFNGVSPKPPFELRNKLDSHVRLLRNRLPKRTADQFKIAVVLQQYQSLAELWDKSSRNSETGKLTPWMAQSRRTLLDEIERANEQRQEEAKKPERSTYLARITKPEEDVDEMRKVFNSYVAAKGKVGEDTSGADFDKFRAALVKQTKAIIDSGKASAVSYRVEIQDGKVAIKAKGDK